MSIGDSILPTVSAVKVLAGAKVKKMKYFTFDGLMFSPIYLAGLADEIGYDYLKVKHDLTKDGSSGYNAISNTIYLNFTYANTIEQESMIVHEATHAMFDFQGKKITVAASESLAYIAQCMFVRLNSTFDPNNPDDRLGSWEYNAVLDKYVSTNRDGVFLEGWRIAGKAIAGETITTDDVDKMKAAVSSHPWYSASASSLTDYNGYR